MSGVGNYHDRERPVPHGDGEMADETNDIVSAEEARGCGDGGCVFRAPSVKGQHTNAGCRCLPLRMTPDERVVLRRRIRGLVVEMDEARERLNGVGVVEYLAARDAATRERERANRADAELDRERQNAAARERLLTRRTDALRAAERERDALRAEVERLRTIIHGAWSDIEHTDCWDDDRLGGVRKAQSDLYAIVMEEPTPMTAPSTIPAPDAPAEEWGRLAVSIPGWRWMPGMSDKIHRLTMADMVYGKAPWGDPDPDDPATAGCLLALLNPRRWDSPAVYQWIDAQDMTYPTLGRACIAAAAALGRWPGGER